MPQNHKIIAFFNGIWPQLGVRAGGVGVLFRQIRPLLASKARWFGGCGTHCNLPLHCTTFVGPKTSCPLLFWGVGGGFQGCWCMAPHKPVWANKWPNQWVWPQGGLQHGWWGHTYHSWVGKWGCMGGGWGGGHLGGGPHTQSKQKCGDNGEYSSHRGELK